jgi:hypothetical protein
VCIHHGTTISLFNRIRSQTVSTKYLGVSSGTQSASNKANGTNATCFVARTGSWDPFVIWLVDTTRSPDTTSIPRPDQHHPSNPDFPPPPAIAIQTPSSTQHPVAVHYNQPVVLQCVSTGLVSPVMVIRKVDKASMVLGGNKTDDLTEKTGGECGDETLGDPVSQLHKVAFQIVQNPMLYHQNKNKLGSDNRSSKWKLPQSCHPVTYLACLNDVVGMHKTTSTRHFVSTCESAAAKATNGQQNTWSELLQKTTNSNGALTDSVGENGDDKKPLNACKLNGTTTKSNGRVGAISNESKGRRNSLLDGGRRGSTAGNDLSGLDGACWTEDVSDAAVWTIVGTDCASYTFWTPSEAPDQSYFNKLFTQQATTTLSNMSAPITPFPLISSQASPSAKLATDSSVTSLTLSGENLTRDLMVWFGDIISPRTDYKSRDSITCTIPGTQELMSSPTVQLEDDGLKRKIPLLLVRGDGVVYRTNQFYVF